MIQIIYPSDMITADQILEVIKREVEAGRQIPREKWISAAFSLNTLLLDEVEKLENLRLELAKLTDGIRRREDCKSLAQAKLEASTSDLHKQTKIQEAKCDQIREFIMIAKKNSDNF